MEKKGKIGGIMLLVSIFLPILWISGNVEDTNIIIIYWLFGLILVSGWGTYIFFIFDLIGMFITLIILVSGLLCILKEGKLVLIAGITSLILIIAYLLWIYNFLAIALNFYGVSEEDLIIIPFISYYCIFIGGILATISGLKSYNR